MPTNTRKITITCAAFAIHVAMLISQLAKMPLKNTSHQPCDTSLCASTCVYQSLPWYLPASAAASKQTRTTQWICTTHHSKPTLTCAAFAIHVAMPTSQFAKMPLKNTCHQPCDTLLCASTCVYQSLPSYVPAATMRPMKMPHPTKLRLQVTTHILQHSMMPDGQGLWFRR